ncbi:hypothetical protein [Akkermansia muciniphila]
MDCVCLAGFMRLVKHPLLKEFPSRILKSILPFFLLFRGFMPGSRP